MTKNTQFLKAKYFDELLEIEYGTSIDSAESPNIHRS